MTLESIKRSSLWAAYGDALGFITELSDEVSIKNRTKGHSRVTALIPWTKRIGGQFGINIELPKGCYSDDTQLRLATSRSIRGDGMFDVETFSKIELPIWLSYALGAGVGTRSAATSLRKRQIQWSTNFFKLGYSQYINSGGNGACMRIQPHVWCAPRRKTNSEILREIIRNTITTHGHCRALIGSAFHALILKKTMLDHSIPGPVHWHSVLSDIEMIPKIIRSDEQLRMYWIKNWESESQQSLEDGINRVIAELRYDISLIAQYIDASKAELYSEYSYRDIAFRLGCFDKKTRGSGTKTALMAAYASYIFGDNTYDGIVTIVNSLGTDTDTIATMAGAIMGVIAKKDPPEEVMDQVYLNEEAERLYNISEGKKTSSYAYPDLLYWQASSSQIKALGKDGNKWTLQGMGELVPIDSEYLNKDKNPTIWQWFRLHFGQTVLLKRSKYVGPISEKLLPIKQRAQVGPLVDVKISNIESKQQKKVPEVESVGQALKQPSLWDNYQYTDNMEEKEITVENAADLVVKNRFKVNVIGLLLLKLAAQENGEEKSMLFAKLIARARIARIKR